MGLGKRLFLEGAAGCTTDTVDKFGDGSGQALYTLDENANDVGGNYNGTSTGVRFGDLGNINYSAYFNGDNIDGTGLNTKYKGAFSFWFKAPDSATNRTFIDSGAFASRSNKGTGIGLMTDGKIRLYVSGGNSSSESIDLRTTQANYDDDEWYHVVCNWDAIDTNSSEIFVNNVSKASGGCVQRNWAASDNSTYDLQMGAYAQAQGGYSYIGHLDHVRIFNRPLTTSEVQTLYEEEACADDTKITLNSSDPFGDGNCTRYFKLDNDVTSEVGAGGTNQGVTFQTSVKLFGTHSGNFSSDYFETNGNISNNMTFSAWVKHGNDIGRLLHATGGAGNYDWFSIFMRTSYIDIGVLARNVGVYWVTSVGQYRYYESSYQHTDASEFYHIGVTFTNTTTAPNIYINGDVQTTTLTQGGTPAATFDWGEIFIGRTFINGTTGYHAGNIDQIRIFDRVLTSDEVHQLYEEATIPEV